MVYEYGANMASHCAFVVSSVPSTCCFSYYGTDRLQLVPAFIFFSALSKPCFTRCAFLLRSPPWSGTSLSLHVPMHHTQARCDVNYLALRSFCLTNGVQILVKTVMLSIHLSKMKTELVMGSACSFIQTEYQRVSPFTFCSNGVSIFEAQNL